MLGMRYQPQGLIRTDWSNPITAGLLSARVAGQQGQFVAGPKGRYMYWPFTSGGYINPDIVPCTGAGTGTLTGLNTVTIVSLVRRNNSSVSGAQCSIRYRSSNSINTQVLAIGTGAYNSNTIITFWGPTNSLTWTAPVAPASGETMFIAGVWDKTNNAQYLYVNGVLVASGSAGANAIPTSNYPYYVYESEASGGNTNVGILPYCNLIYNRVLSASEIFNLYNNIWQVFENTVEYNLDFDYVSTVGPTIISTAGSSSGAANLSATALAIFNAFGNSQGTAANASSSTAIANSTGASAGTCSTSGPIISLFSSGGACAGSSSGTVSSVSVYLTNGESQSSATVVGNAYSVWSVQANSTGESDAVAGGITIFPVAGSSDGLSTVAGESAALAPTFGSADGAATGTSTANADATSFYSAIANSVGLATASGEGVILACASGSSTGLTDVSALSVAIYGADGIAVSSAQVQAEVSYIASVLASSQGRSTVSGVTSSGLHYTAVGDKFSITIVFAPYSVNFQTEKYRITFN